MEKTSNLTQLSIIYSEETKNVPLVSVVVTTKNEEKNIENCLKSVRNQTLKKIQLIVVDNFSSDKTAEMAKKYLAEVYFKGNERSAQRNYGAKVASGEYLLYLDADMILSSTLVEECVEKCRRYQVDALYIPERIVGKGFWIKVRDFERSFYTGTIIDAVRFIRRDLFLQVGGFDETLVGPEDWDFDRKIRKLGQTAVISQPLFHNEGQFNLKHYLRKKGYYTEGIQRYIKKYGHDDQETMKQTGVSYRLIGVFIEKGNWKKVICHPLLTFGLYFLRINVALEYLRRRN